MDYKCKGIMRALLGLQHLVCVYGYIYYQERIPNGEHVNYPDRDNFIWHGVGHQNAGGGGTLNPFGRDFAANGHKWTRDLCRMDSDKDGMTNGEELGDPDCVWRPGRTDLLGRTYDISHPGICQPTINAKCEIQNDWDFRGKEEYNCPDIKEPEVRNMTLRFTRTEIPATETNYFCQLFDLPADRDYHIIGSQPSIDNREVMHHILLYGCDELDSKLQSWYTAPAACGMQAKGKCGTQLGGWTVGQTGDCNFGLDAGFRIGKTAYTKVLLEFHYNNPRERSGMTDASGFTIYYTPKLKSHDLGIIAVGQMGLHIPPGSKGIDMVSECKQKCTKSLTKPLNIVGTGMHMHYLGTSGSVAQYRNGKFLRYLANDEQFRYDSPVEHTHNPPVEFRAGDSLVTKCGFKSTYRTGITYWGDGTQEEMCFGFISYYPKSDFSECIQFGTMDTCLVNDTVVEDRSFDVGGCDLKDHNTLNVIYEELSAACDMSGRVCTDACRRMLIDDPHPCFRGDAKFFLEWLLPRVTDEGLYLTQASRSCDMEALGLRSSITTPENNVVNVQNAAAIDAVGAVHLVALGALLLATVVCT